MPRVYASHASDGSGDTCGGGGGFCQLATAASVGGEGPQGGSGVEEYGRARVSPRGVRRPRCAAQSVYAYRRRPYDTIAVRCLPINGSGAAIYSWTLITLIIIYLIVVYSLVSFIIYTFFFLFITCDSTSFYCCCCLSCAWGCVLTNRQKLDVRYNYTLLLIFRLWLCQDNILKCIIMIIRVHWLRSWPRSLDYNIYCVFGIIYKIYYICMICPYQSWVQTWS